MSLDDHIIVGCNTGKLKAVCSLNGQSIDVNGSILDSQNAVLSLYQSPYHIDSLISETKSGRIDLLSVKDNEIYSNSIGCNISSPLAGLVFVNETQVCVCQKSTGALHLYELADSKFSYDHKIESLELGQTNKFTGTHEHNIVATGGERNNLKLWDLNAGKQTYRARNPPHDKLSLAVDIDITDILVMDERNRMFTGTRQKQIHFIDCLDGSNRALAYINFGQHPITVLARTNDTRLIVVGDAAGTVGLIDIRKSNLVVQHYKGASSSIKGLACHNDVLVSASIDGFIRGYNLNTRELLWKNFLKSRLSCLKKIAIDQYSSSFTLDPCIEVLHQRRKFRTKSKSYHFGKREIRKNLKYVIVEILQSSLFITEFLYNQDIIKMQNFLSIRNIISGTLADQNTFLKDKF
ncbi:hypothetical protein GJ496_005148 [Pomphorhynchus laevis]|nr:hypothetical protein GJ496_005148 [Pomphorhynchus laevis]